MTVIIGRIQNPPSISRFMYYKYCLGIVGFVSYEQFCQIIDTVIYCEFNFTIAANVLGIN